MWFRRGYGAGMGGFGKGFGCKGFGVGFGRYGEGGYGRFSSHLIWSGPPQPITNETIIRKIKEILSNSKLGAKFVNPWGLERYTIVNNDRIIGWIWENLPLGDVEVSNVWKIGDWVKGFLYHRGVVVGTIWFNLSQFK